LFWRGVFGFGVGGWGWGWGLGLDALGERLDRDVHDRDGDSAAGPRLVGQIELVREGGLPRAWIGLGLG